MKKPKITEGEWKVREINNDTGRILWFDITPNGTSQTLAMVEINEYVPINEETARTNAQAISAVPELIEELIDTYQWMIQLKGTHSHLVSEDELRNIEQTLQKAGVEFEKELV